MRWPRKLSNIIRTSVKFSKNPSTKNAGSGKRNEQNSYYSPPLVGKSNGEDTITTHFDWKKQKPILLVDRWEDQTATEDTTATLHKWSEGKGVVRFHGNILWYQLSHLFTSTAPPTEQNVQNQRNFTFHYIFGFSWRYFGYLPTFGVLGLERHASVTWF